MKHKVMLRVALVKPGLEFLEFLEKVMGGHQEISAKSN
jgi:hypothetical protein